MCISHIHLLYVFRCAVYYASNDIHNPELLKWELENSYLMTCPHVLSV